MRVNQNADIMEGCILKQVQTCFTRQVQIYTILKCFSQVPRHSTCPRHTLLRLPTGVFYAQGVKANVLFFERRTGGEQAATQKLWIYDLRTNMNFTLKTNTLTRADLDDFVKCYHPENRHERQETWSEENPEGRWRAFTYEELAARDKFNLDIFWVRDESLEDSANLPDPDILAAEIIEDLQAALVQFQNVHDTLEGNGE